VAVGLDGTMSLRRPEAYAGPTAGARQPGPAAWWRVGIIGC